MRVVYEVPYIDVVKVALFNPVMLTIIALTTGITALIFAFLVRGIPLWRAIAFIALLVGFLIASVVLLLPDNLKYGVEDGFIVVNAYGEHRISIGKGVNITLVDYESVKPTLRLMGVSLPGLAIGEFKLRTGAKAVVFTFKPEDKAILITYGDKVFVISHPGVEEAYRKLLEMVEGVEASHSKP